MPAIRNEAPSNGERIADAAGIHYAELVELDRTQKSRRQAHSGEQNRTHFLRQSESPAMVEAMLNARPAQAPYGQRLPMSC